MLWRNVCAVVAYDGTDYGGFQIQTSRSTIQGELERALQRLTQASVRVHGAGRTDAGVHAVGQVISFRIVWRHELSTLKQAMNAVLPRDISIREIAEVDETFHARFSAVKRMYVYKAYRSDVRSPILDRFAWRVSAELNVPAMNLAAAQLQGERDFAAWGQPPAGDVTVRQVHRAAWRIVNQTLGPYGPDYDQYWFEIEANAFLRGMVRRIVSTLLSVGSGLLASRDVESILASRDISRVGPPAPACGLYLWRVWYAQHGAQAAGELAPLFRAGEQPR